jgi:hypothetical protein
MAKSCSGGLGFAYEDLRGLSQIAYVWSLRTSFR